jgi:hypothetical protein
MCCYLIAARMIRVRRCGSNESGGERRQTFSINSSTVIACCMSKEMDSIKVVENNSNTTIPGDETTVKVSRHLSFIVEEPAPNGQPSSTRARRVHKKSRQGCSNCKKARVKVRNVFLFSRKTC